MGIISMVNYQCIRCGYETKDKSKIKSHLSRKTVCKPYLYDVNLDDYKDMILNCKKIVIEKSINTTYNYDSKMTQKDSKMILGDSKMTQKDSKMVLGDSKMT